MDHATASRRAFLRGAAGLGAVGLAPSLGWAAAGSPAYLAAAGLPDGGFCLIGLTALGEEAFRLPLPARGHAAAAHPARPEAVAFARRPGAFALVIDCAAGAEIARLTAPEGRHFYGHGAFSPDGVTLFTTENDIGAGVGRVGVWDASDGYRRIGEVASGGVGPHEILLMPDGARLAVANGGLLTDPSSGRTNLNVADMQPSLAYLDVGTGDLVERLELPAAFRMNSIRHISAADSGALAMALQWVGSELETPPLLAVHLAGTTSLELIDAPAPLQRRMRNYAGSVAFGADARHVAVTAPRGDLMLVYDLATPGEAVAVDATDVCGVARGTGGFRCTTGAGAFLRASMASGESPEALRSVSPVAFDNHLVAI